MLNDLRQSLRLFTRTPGFAAAAVASIGLAVGANAAIFSLADAVFLRPLDVPEPSRLVTVGTRPWRNDGLQSMADYADFRDANRSFENVAAVRIVRAGVTRHSDAPAELRMGFAVSSNFRQRLDRGARGTVVRSRAVHAGADRAARHDAARGRNPSEARGVDRSAARAAARLIFVGLGLMA